MPRLWHARPGLLQPHQDLVGLERWDLVLDGATVPVYDKPEQHARRLWAEGRTRRQQTDHRRANAHHQMERVLNNVTATVRPLTAAETELAATIAARNGEHKRANELFRNADIEAALIDAEPPSYTRPIVEAWRRRWALALDDYKSAEWAYREASSREPGSGRAYFSVAAAFRGQSKTEDAPDGRTGT